MLKGILIRLFGRASNEEAAVDVTIDNIPGPKLHLGCGTIRLANWINIDRMQTNATDRVLDFRSIDSVFEPNSVGAVLMIHSISYLRIWEARDLFLGVRKILKPGGYFILEFPDAEKCAEKLLAARGRPDEYLEGIRGLYAFDLGQVERREEFVPYHFGWSGWHITKELKAVGFENIVNKDPVTHGARIWRDTRIEAIKSTNCC